MDPGFVERHWSALPHLDALRRKGTFSRLQTTTPPQSPVAWSTFITGLDPDRARHLRFRPSRSRRTHAALSLDRQDDRPALHPPARPVCSIPLRVRTSNPCAAARHSGKLWRARRSRHRDPHARQLPSAPKGNEISGMETPDLRGTQSTFAFYTDDPTRLRTTSPAA
jgi:hypothetical protein